VRRNVLWVTDPWDTLDHQKDTTLRLIQASIEFGDHNYWCDYLTIKLIGEEVFLDAREVITCGYNRSDSSFILGIVTAFSIKTFDLIYYRVDPPVNSSYRNHLQLLSLGVELSFLHKSKICKIINPPTQLLTTSEKFGQSVIKNLFPASVVSCQLETLTYFGKEKQLTVIKPLNNAQSKGVKLLEWTDKSKYEHNTDIIKEITKNFTVPVLLQEFLPGVKDGEVRLWFVNGKLLAAVKKVSMRDDFIINIDLGDSLFAVTLSLIQLNLVSLIAEHLIHKNIFLAAVDIIDNKITDYNITSPGLIVQMEEILDLNLASRIILESAKII
jgi:glutathione synthase